MGFNLTFADHALSTVTLHPKNVWFLDSSVDKHILRAKVCLDSE